MTFAQSIGTCFSKYATFKGRASRSEFWWFHLFLFLIYFPTAIAIGVFVVGIDKANAILNVGTIILVVTLIVPTLAVTVRRLHDMSQSGWWVLSALLFSVFVYNVWLALYAWCILKGSDTENKYDESLALDTPTAKQGSAFVQYILGRIYLTGLIVSKDDVQAAKWFLKAAKQGHAFAQFNLGVMYYNGESIPKDNAQAVVWIQQAADQWHGDAQNTLGLMYSEGDGVSQNYENAEEWFRSAAEQGHREGQNNLGLIYSRGNGVVQDYIEAEIWFRQAAEFGHANAQFNLGLMYANGDGVTENFVLAYKWWNIAAAQGDEDAKGNKAIIKKEMTREQIAEAQKLASEFVAVKE